MDFKHEYNGTGAHRIVGPAGPGPWASFDNYALIAYNGQYYIAFSDYFVGGELQPGVIYRAQDPTLDPSQLSKGKKK